MSLSSEAAHTQLLDHQALKRALALRPLLVEQFVRTQAVLSRYLASEAVSEWSTATLSSYAANAGQAVLLQLWQLQRHIVPGATATIVLELGRAAQRLCLHAGSSKTVALLSALEMASPHGSDGRPASIFLSSVADLAVDAPEVVPEIAAKTAHLMSQIDVTNIAKWFDDGLRLYRHDRARRVAYFRLEDPIAVARLAIHAGRARFSSHEPRLRYLARSLWNSELCIQELPLPSDAMDHGRIRIMGKVTLIPENFSCMPTIKTAAFFEAAIMHTMAHQRYTTQKFRAAGMKPIQVALTALIEDARVERLAADRFPGLGRLWRSQHTISASSARTCASLFERLARALCDPGFEDLDQWIKKACSTFEAAFAEDPFDQHLSIRIARRLGHDLGQARIPFPAKSHVAEPAYRDDGFGLFDFDDETSTNSNALEMQLEAARMDENTSETQTDSSLGDHQETQTARVQPEEAEPSGAVIAIYPEWDYRLQTNIHSVASVIDTPAHAESSPSWLTHHLEENRPTAARIRGLVSTARVGQIKRKRHLLEGDELDLDAAHDTRVARSSGTLPDPRIYTSKHRISRDIAIALLIDTSQSTADMLPTSGATILQMAAISAAMTGEAIASLGDSFAIYAFSSNGREAVSISTVKGFGENRTAMVDRLAALRAGNSTRLGAAIRHVSSQLQQQLTQRKLMIVITDGEPADIDEIDPSYLAEDARQAVAEARRHGLDMFSVALGGDAAHSAATIFGKRNTLPVDRIEDLATRLAGLYFRLTVS